jgi:hypothetical protein
VLAVQRRDVQAGAAPATTRAPAQWPEAGSPAGGAPDLEQLPEPEGERWLPFLGETAEFKANHYEWAHKRCDTLSKLRLWSAICLSRSGAEVIGHA